MSSTTSNKSYECLHALLLYWKNGDPVFTEDVRAMQEVLEEVYGFEVHVLTINNDTDDEKLTVDFVTKVIDFVDENLDGDDTLIFVYYAGHGCPKNGLLQLAGPNPQDLVPFSRIQSQLQKADADVLIITDCCYAGASFCNTSERQKIEASGAGRTEMLCACPENGTTPALWDHSFTKTLTDVLLNQAVKQQPISVSDVYWKLWYIRGRLRSLYPSSVINSVHKVLNGDLNSDIILRPLEPDALENMGIGKQVLDRMALTGVHSVH